MKSLFLGLFCITLWAEGMPSPIRGSKESAIVLGVPLSGPLSVYGQKSRQAFLSGLSLSCENKGERFHNYAILSIDTHDSKEKVLEQLKKYYETYHVLALVGDLTKESDEWLTQFAEEKQVPQLSLLGKNKPSGAVWSLGFSPEQQATQLADLVFQQLNFKNVAILYPDHGFGKNFKDQFEKHFQSLKGVIATSYMYSSKETTFTAIIEAFKKKIGRHSLDAILIPEFPKTLEYIVPAFLAGDILISNTPALKAGFKKIHEKEIRYIPLIGPQAWRELNPQLVEGAFYVEALEPERVFRGCQDSYQASPVEWYAQEAGDILKNILTESFQTPAAVMLKLSSYPKVRQKAFLMQPKPSGQEQWKNVPQNLPPKSPTK